MSERGDQLLQTVDAQINELTGLLSQGDHAGLSLRCPGREKLGDGTVGALASHTADSYLRIAMFLQASRHADRPDAPGAHGRGPKAETVELAGLLERLSTGREALRLIADLTDKQLDTVPPADSFRFCDGHRTLEQVVSGLLKHQSHQIEAIRSALG